MAALDRLPPRAGRAGVNGSGLVRREMVGEEPDRAVQFVLGEPVAVAARVGVQGRVGPSRTRRTGPGSARGVPARRPLDQKFDRHGNPWAEAVTFEKKVAAADRQCRGVEATRVVNGSGERLTSIAQT